MTCPETVCDLSVHLDVPLIPPEAPTAHRAGKCCVHIPAHRGGASGSPYSIPIHVGTQVLTHRHSGTLARDYILTSLSPQRASE